jgi:HlyD family secretion protein
MKSYAYFVLAILTFCMSCQQQEDQADAYGNFEAIELIVAAESQGKILSFVPREGASLKQDQLVVIVDTLQLHLKKLQLKSGETSLNAKGRTLDSQVRSNQVQLQNLEREKKRVDRLVEGGAATTKQQDDLEGQVEVLRAQIVALESQKASLEAERQTLDVQIRQVEDQIARSLIRSPMDGILLTKYREQGEIAAPGQPLFKMADLDTLILRAYISGNQLAQITVGGRLKVRYDVPGGMEETTGVVSWISSKAEFTPKIIQTKEERVNLVYAIKVEVANEGSLKIGMPGEVLF